jgi:alkylation response protein AidB-like acyl-CoA dehydrogenase
MRTSARHAGRWWAPHLVAGHAEAALEEARPCVRQRRDARIHDNQRLKRHPLLLLGLPVW